MRKLHYLPASFFLLLVFIEIGYAQPTEEWAVRYNGPDNKNDNGRIIATDNLGNVYVTGASQEKNDYSIATIKYNAGGTQLWVARYSGQGKDYDYPFGLAIDPEGNVYVTGRSQGNGTGMDIATIKYNSAGQQQWIARYNGAANLNDIPGDVKVDAAGNVFVTGYSDGSGVAGPGSAIVILKYNAAGVQQWVAKYDALPNGIAANREEGVSLALDGNGDILVTGVSGGLITLKYNQLGQLLWSRAGSGSNGRKILCDVSNNVYVTSWGDDYVTVKYDTDGNLLWEALYNGGTNTDGVWDMVLDASDNILITGISSNGSNNDYATVKYNSAGVQQWVARFNGFNDRDHARAIAVDNNGNAYVTGFTTEVKGRQTNTYYATIKYASATGNQEWLAIYKGPDNASSGFDVAVDAADNVFVTGETASKVNFDYGTVKYSQGVAARSSYSTPVSENKNTLLQSVLLKNFPNPFTQSTTIEYQLTKTEWVTISVFDLKGNKVATLVNEEKPAGIYSVQFKADRLSAGTYICRLQAGEFIENRKLGLIK